MISNCFKLGIIFLVIACSSCAMGPSYYGPGAPDVYGYYDYDSYPGYPWDFGADIDIGNGYGHGGWHGHHGFGHRGFGHGGGGHGGGGHGGGGRR